MFRHLGKSRNLTHNLQIASLLSFVAGLVNVAGFLSVDRLTTNVTGHFAFLVDEVLNLNPFGAWIFFSFILSFFLGSFVSNLIVEFILRKNERYVYAIPVFIEVLILTLIAFVPATIVLKSPNVLACVLLFAMGLQNSLVTSISKSMVRTTHLTGLFTDLGIELSQLFFYRSKEQSGKLISSIKLRTTIIVFFFLGGILGGIAYTKIHLHTFVIGAVLLISGIIYDAVNFKLTSLRRKNNAYRPDEN